MVPGCPSLSALKSSSRRTDMLSVSLRVAAAAGLALSVACDAGVAHNILPLGGSDGAQLGIVLGSGLVAHEVEVLVAAAWTRFREWRRKPASIAELPRQ